MVPLGYGKFVRADRVYALVPLEGAERKDGRRTYVHVDGLSRRHSAPPPLDARAGEPALSAESGPGAPGRAGRFG